MKQFFSILLILVIVNTGRGQDWNTVFTYEIDAEYFISEGNYELAADTYLKALQIVPNSANLSFKVGFCYLKSDGLKGKALDYLQKAAENISKNYDSRSLRELKAPAEALFHLGVAYMHKEQFDSAIDCFKRYKEMSNSSDDYVLLLVEQRIKSCNNAKEILAMGEEYKVSFSDIGISDDGNSTYNAVISGDGNTLAFTSRTDLGNQVLISKLADGKWSDPVNITARLGSKILRTCFISYDGTELFMVEEDFNGARLVSSRLNGDKWSKVKTLPKPISSKFNEDHLCITSDGQTAYFTSDRKGGKGGFDIYKSVKVNDKWGNPENLGEAINTPLDEKTPFLTADDRYLFFSSEGHDGIGGLDILYTDLTDPSQKIISIGYPLNTPDDDMFYVPKTLKQGCFATVKPKASEVKSIYTTKILPYYDVRVNTQLASQELSGTGYTLCFKNNADGSMLKEATLRGIGQVKMKLTSGTYSISAIGDEIEQASVNLVITEDAPKQQFTKTLVLNKLPQVIEQPVAQLVEPVSVEVAVEKPQVQQPTITQEPAIASPKSVAVEAQKKTVSAPTPRPKPKPTPIPASETIDVVKSQPKRNTARKSAVYEKADEHYTGYRISYSVQLFASEQPADIQHISMFDSIDVTISPSGYYRYSIGCTNSVDEVEKWIQSVKAKGYKNAYARINREHPGYTIQVMALTKPKSLRNFDNLDGVMVERSSSGVYRYIVGKYATKEEAQADVQRIVDLGYVGAYVRVL